jgi:probable rRNA maturation factor
VQFGIRPDDAPTRVQLRRWARAALQGDAEVTLRLVDEVEGEALNGSFRGRRHATNVLTFA